MAFVKSTDINSSENKLNFKRTSSLNNYFLCHYCDRKFVTKNSIEVHVECCRRDRTCKWCNIEFKNRGNLVTHAYYVHDDKSIKAKIVQTSVCNVCNKPFSNPTSLKYHIRRVHYNLTAKIPNYDNKEIDQTWYETVHDTDTIVEVKKSAQNVLLIRKIDKNKDIQTEDCRVILDLTSFYHTGNRVSFTTCDICTKVVLERDYKKHYDEAHGEVTKHHCNNCNMTFKRSYFFIRHKCTKKKRVRAKLRCTIEKVESLTPIPI